MITRLYLQRTSALLATLACLALSANAQTVRVEAENFVPPTGTATVGSGPNSAGIVSVDSSGARSGGKYIGYFVYWDWLEYDFTVPEDGTYSITFSYTSDWALNGFIPTVISFYTSGQQVISKADIPKTANWGDWQTFTLPQTVALKAGSNRMRVAMRPDAMDAITQAVTIGGGMNTDYIEFSKTGPYPALSAVSGTVTTTVGGSPAPLEGALVSVGADYNSASYVARTNSAGAYTLYVPAGSQSITAFANGFAKSTVTVTAPGTQNFTLAFNGRFEAELLDGTNNGFDRSEGFQAEYTTETKIDNQPRSNFGQLVEVGQGKFATYKHVVVPAAGVYDLSMNYASGVINDSLGYGRYNVTVNGGSSSELRWGLTGDNLTYQDCDPIFVTLNQGANTIKVQQPDTTSWANVDYFTLVPTTRNPGTLRVVVTSSTTSLPVIGASVKITGTNSQDIGITGADGSLSIPVAAGSYDIQASRSGASASTTANVTAGSTTTANIQLAITAVLVEAEDFVASGPNTPSVDIVENPTASGGKTISNLSGQDRPEWAEWILNATQDGMYQVSITYASVQYPGAHTLNVWNTFYRQEVPDGLPLTADGNDYQTFTYPYNIPLKAGENRLRLTFGAYGAGAINMDFLTYERISAYPTLKSCSGSVKGKDGGYVGAIQNADVWIATNEMYEFYHTRTPSSGAWTISIPSTIGLIVNVDAEGYTSPGPKVVFANGIYNAELSFNNPNLLTPAVMQVNAKTAVAVHPDIRINTSEPGEVWNGSPGKWFEMIISVPRTGIYKVGMGYSSGWNSGDGQPVKSVWTVNGSPVNVDFAKTANWADYQYFDNIASLPLNAGANVIRITYVEASANVQYFTFVRTGDIPSTDIDGSGKTELKDAVVYNRRLAGVDTGATPDLNGDSVSNTLDVARIIKVAAGLQ
jgi:hypothetical protein